jgi:hypothetical protein
MTRYQVTVRFTPNDGDPVTDTFEVEAGHSEDARAEGLDAAAREFNPPRSFGVMVGFFEVLSTVERKEA